MEEITKTYTPMGLAAPRWAPIGDDYRGSILSPNVIRRVRGSCRVTAGSRRGGQAFSVHFQDLLQILSWDSALSDAVSQPLWFRLSASMVLTSSLCVFGLQDRRRRCESGWIQPDGSAEGKAKSWIFCWPANPSSSFWPANPSSFCPVQTCCWDFLSNPLLKQSYVTAGINLIDQQCMLQFYSPLMSYSPAG